jgi:Tfp pilus assembly protein PilF
MNDIKTGKQLLTISPKELKIISVIGALVLLAFIYIHHFTNGFFYDDAYLIQENLAIRSLKNIPQFFTDVHTAASRPEYQNQYRPFYTLSFAIDYFLGNGLSLTVMHVHTFIGFLVLCRLCFLLAQKIFQPIARDPFYPALFSVCLFAFHPATADVINYLYARTNSFATLYGLAFMMSYLSVPFFRKYHLYLVPLLIACLFKSIAIMFVPLLWLYIIFFEYDMGFNQLWPAIKKTYKPMLPGILVVLIASVLVFIKSRTNLATVPLSYSTHLMTQSHVLLNYFLIFFMPERINPNGWRDFIESPFDPQFLAGFLFIISSLVLIYLFSLRKSTRAISYGLAWFFLCQVPTSVLFPLLIPQVDYYMFNSEIGLAFAVAATVTLFISRMKDMQLTKPIVIAGSVILLCLTAYGSRLRTKVWSSDEKMWEDVVKKDPTNGRVLMNLGVYRLQENKLDEANDYFNKAIAYYPNYDLIYVNMGILKNRMNDTLTANIDFKKAVDLHGWDHYESCFFYARFLDQWNHDDLAISLLNDAVQEYPSYIDAWQLLLSIYGKRQDARLGSASRQVLRLFPNDLTATNYLKLYLSDSTNYKSSPQTEALQKTADARPSVNAYIALSLVYFRNSEFEKCIEQCKKALALDPNNAIAYNNMCSAYNNLHQWDKAIEAGEQAVKLQPDFALAKNNLNFAQLQKKAQGN